MPPAHLAGKVNGASAYYPDIAASYPSSQAEHELEMNLEYDVQSLDELERRFLEETIALTKDQNKEEDKENARHRERLREIQEQFQHKMTKLRAKQAKSREDFLRAEAQRRYQTSPRAPNYSHYQYGGSGGSSLPPPTSGRSASNYVDPLPAHAVSAYVDPLPQYEGSYEGSYDQGFDKGYDQNPADSSSLQPIRSTVYDSYPEASYSPGAASFNRKQGSYDKPGYDKPGYDKRGYDGSNAYNAKSQVYDTKSYSYGTAQYPAYG